MADFEEDSVFTEGVRAFEATDPARFDVLNNTIKPLVDRTRYLYDNMGQGGGGGGTQGTPVEWIVADGGEVYLSDLTPGTMYILDTRNGMYIDVLVQGDSAIPVGSEFHFVCAGDPTKAYMYELESE